MTLRSASSSLALVFGLCGCNLAVGVVAALQPYHSAGDFDHEYADRAHARQTIDCLDVAVDLATEGGSTIVEWRMGNRCNAAVTTDLSRLVVTELHPDSTTTPVALRDPNGEIGPRDLAPRRAALERIALEGGPLDKTDARVCVDASRVVDHREGPAAAPLCFLWTDRWLARGPS